MEQINPKEESQDLSGVVSQPTLYFSSSRELPNYGYDRTREKRASQKEIDQALREYEMEAHD